MKKSIKRWLASVLAGCMTFSVTACGESAFLDSSDSKTPEEATYSYLAIDINPSIELLIEDETVIKVKACNDDAAVLLSGENLENMDVEAASKKIVELAEELGYLTSENDAVKITVSADEEGVIACLEKKAIKGAQEGSELAKVNSAPRSADERKVKKLQQEDAEKYGGLTPAKLRLIEAIMQYDETMTYELGAAMKVAELADLLDKLMKEFEDVIGEEMEEMFQSKYEEAKILAARRIAEIYGEEYLTAWERYVALEKVVHDIEKNAKNLIVNADDVEKLLGMLEDSEEQDSSSQSEESSTTEEESSEITSEEVEEEVEEESEEGVNLEGKPEDELSDFPEREEDNRHNSPQQPNHENPQKPEKPEEECKEDWKVEDINKYFDKNFHGRFDDEKMKNAEEKLNEILDAYDEEVYVLTAEDLAALETAWGEAVSVTTFGELEEFLEAEEEKLEELRESVPLTEEQKKLIELAEKVMNGLKDTVRDLMKNEMATAKDKFHEMKQEKMKK